MNLNPGKRAFVVQPAAPRKEFADILAGGGREHVKVVVPRTDIEGSLRLLARHEVVRVHGATRSFLLEQGLPGTPRELEVAGLGQQWNMELATQILAIAVRDPANEGRPLTCVEDWRECDDDQIDTLSQIYQDLRERLDPLGEDSAELSTEERAGIETAAKKGESAVLMSFGSRRLALYAISTVAPPVS